MYYTAELYKKSSTKLPLTFALEDLKNRDIPVGDKVIFPLIDGDILPVVVADISDSGTKLVVEDISFNKGMNLTITNQGGWRDCDLRRTLRDEVLPRLPEDLRTAIKPQTIIQRIDGESYFSQDELWIPSYTEVFGYNEFLKEMDFGDKQFEVFKNRRNRVKFNKDGYPAYWWLRSAYSSSSFYLVNSIGGNTTNFANSAYGVVFGFVI